VKTCPSASKIVPLDTVVVEAVKPVPEARGVRALRVKPRCTITRRFVYRITMPMAEAASNCLSFSSVAFRNHYLLSSGDNVARAWATSRAEPRPGLAPKHLVNIMCCVNNAYAERAFGNKPSNTACFNVVRLGLVSFLSTFAERFRRPELFTTAVFFAIRVFTRKRRRGAAAMARAPLELGREAI
jgi:hypothetical protein